MKVDPSSLHRVGRSTVTGVGHTGLDGVRPAEGLESSRALEVGDQLELSRRAEEIRAARAALADTPEVRAQRVAQLKAQVAAGTYRVDPEKVAERILNPRA